MKIHTSIRPGRDNENYTVAVYIETEPEKKATIRVVPTRAMQDMTTPARAAQVDGIAAAKLLLARIIQELRTA